MTNWALSVQYADKDDTPPAAEVRALLKSTLPQGGEITVRFVGTDEMRQINRQWRGKNTPSDVLSFAYHNAQTRIVGDIILCPAIAKQTARERGILPQHHLSHLIVHGALHLSGLHHDTAAAAAQMEDTEREVLARFGIADPYLS